MPVGSTHGFRPRDRTPGTTPGEGNGDPGCAGGSGGAAPAEGCLHSTGRLQPTLSVRLAAAISRGIAGPSPAEGTIVGSGVRPVSPTVEPRRQRLVQRKNQDPDQRPAHHRGGRPASRSGRQRGSDPARRQALRPLSLRGVRPETLLRRVAQDLRLRRHPGDRGRLGRKADPAALRQIAAGLTRRRGFPRARSCCDRLPCSRVSSRRAAGVCAGDSAVAPPGVGYWHRRANSRAIAGAREPVGSGRRRERRGRATRAAPAFG